MLKKVLILGSVLLASIGIATCTVTQAQTVEGEKIVLLEETTTGTETPAETTPTAEAPVEYPCKVKETVSKGGTVLFDKTEGDVGDVVTAYIKADFLFSIKSIKFNDAEVKINSENKYEFTLVEGENILSVDCEINNEKLTEIADLINGVQKNGFASLFTVSNLLNLISWVVTVFLSSGFFITLIRNKKIKATTVNQVKNAVIDTLDSNISEALLKFLEKVITPILNTMLEKVDGTNECIKIFCKCYALAQEDTPENRLAIINELTKLSNNDEELTNKIKQIIRQEQKAQEEKIAARDKAIEDLETTNDNLLNFEEKADEYGQF